jgi:hypothetical protein
MSDNGKYVADFVLKLWTSASKLWSLVSHASQQNLWRLRSYTDYSEKPEAWSMYNSSNSAINQRIPVWNCELKARLWIKSRYFGRT